MLNRRETLRLVAGAAAAFLAGDGFTTRLRAASAPAVLTPEQEQGPFYIGAEHIRRMITDGRPGVPLDLQITLVNASTGHPLPGAAIDIWHCDAGGVYSGFEAMKMGPPPGAGGQEDSLAALDGLQELDHMDDFNGPDRNGPPPFRGMGGGPGGSGPHLTPTNASRFLRGVQLTDARGTASFTTIYPGWYAGREIHIHLKVHLGGSTSQGGYVGGHVCHTGQLFFPDETNGAVSRQQPYASSQTPRTTKVTDHVYRDENGDKSVVAIHAVTDNPGLGYFATITLAVDPSASPKPVGFA